MYVGEYRVALDDKSRMRIPSKLKNQLGGQAVTICAGTEKSLFLMTETQFRKWVGESAENSLISERERQNALRMISSTVFYPEEDGQGRFVLPAKLRAYAGIDKKVVFLGAINRIEIWSEEAYEASYGVDQLDINAAVKALNM